MPSVAMRPLGRDMLLGEVENARGESVDVGEGTRGVVLLLSRDGDGVLLMGGVRAVEVNGRRPSIFSLLLLLLLLPRYLYP